MDDTLVLIKPCDIPLVLKKFNSFDKNLNFTVDKFEDGKVHFLDLEISESGIDVFRKTTHTGQYTNFHSFEPWSRKTAWIKSLFCRAVRICSNTFFLNRQISTISKFMAWNGFPASFRCAILRKLKSKHNSNNPAPYSNTSSENNLSNNTADENISKIWVRIPFLGKQGEYLVKTLIRKLQRNLTKPVKFIVIYQTKKVSYFLSKKDKIPDLERNDLVYEFSCPGCSATYIGKTVRNLRTRLTEHAQLNTSAVSEHLKTCEHARHITDLYNLYDNINDLNPDKPFSNYELIANNTKILQSLQHTNSNILLFLEALHIKFKRPALNSGLKASKELMLFV